MKNKYKRADLIGTGFICILAGMFIGVTLMMVADNKMVRDDCREECQEINKTLTYHENHDGIKFDVCTCADIKEVNIWRTPTS